MERIAVYGAGTIGSCQATLIIGNGLPCTVIGHSERGLERCRKSIEQNWDDLIAEGLATEGNKQAAMALVTITNALPLCRSTPSSSRQWRRALRKSGPSMRPSSRTLRPTW